MLLKENEKDYQLLETYKNLCKNEKLKLVVIIGGTTLAFHNVNNWVAKYFFENVDYKHMIVKVTPDRVKVYFDSKEN